MDATDRRIINSMQGEFPLAERPFLIMSERLGLSEEELIGRIARMRAEGILTRFGPMYHADRMGGRFTLAAMSVPDEDFERVAAIVNAYPEVAHNYEREHALNMWFVLATETPEQTPEAIARLEAETGYPVYPMPKEREYFVELRLRA
jgi:DNA-binding Lrp family transcriptional regulator